MSQKEFFKQKCLNAQDLQDAVNYEKLSKKLDYLDYVNDGIGDALEDAVSFEELGIEL